MSWFDATGLVNIAKSALKEAQKTIDKALDIKDDGSDLSESEDFQENEKKNISGSSFISPGSLNEKKCISDSHLSSLKNVDHPITPLQASNWGSFAGSFFDADVSNSNKNVLISTQPQKFQLVLDVERDAIAPLASPENELTPTEGECSSERKNCNLELCQNGRKDRPETIQSEISSEALITEITEFIWNLEGTANENIKPADENIVVDDKVSFRHKTIKNANRNSFSTNRLSLISSESEGKRSGDSVEIIESHSCTTSPDADLPSASTSSSLGLPVSSSGTDSVEVINTMTSPSSIEVIESGASTVSSIFTTDICSNDHSKELVLISGPKKNLTDISPESVEVLPDLNEFDEELSLGESYTSASESTAATVLEPQFHYSHRTAGSHSDILPLSKLRSEESVTSEVSVKKTSEIHLESTNEVYDLDFMSSREVQPIDLRSASNFEQRMFHSSNTIGVDHSPIIKSYGSPTKKLKKGEDKVMVVLKSEDPVYLKNDLYGFDAINNRNKKEISDEYAFCSNVCRNDGLSIEEICGSMSSHSDSKTVVANDSSREGTLMESSAEDNPTLECTGNIAQECIDERERERKKIQEVKSSNCSFYVKHLLADAIGEDLMTRETSPTLSEKSRSEMVKVESEQTSEHTSGDELETTTSSDIEIISRYSPNGDSSSTSRHSPAKLLQNNSKGKLSLVAVDILGKVPQSKVKVGYTTDVIGHQREPSEASSFCSEDNSTEVDKLTKKVTELTEILADRELKLIDLGKCNLEMEERNQELKKSLEVIKLEAEARMTLGLSDSEKDEVIQQLREEGDKLSKKELKQANLIKTLRAQEKLQQSTIDKNKCEIQNLTKELEKVKEKLIAKENLEKIQAENVNQLTNKINKQDKEIANLLDEIEMAAVKAEKLKLELEKSQQELDTCKEKLVCLDVELSEARSIADVKGKKLDAMDNNQVKIELELNCIKEQLKRSEQMYSEREHFSREEKCNLMRRLQEAERRNEELTQSVSHATKPLLRQMEALQATIAHERETWEKQERNLLQKLDETEVNLSSAQYHEKAYKEEVVELRLKVTNLESQLKASSNDSIIAKEKVRILEMELEAARQANEAEKKNHEKVCEKMQSDICELKNEVSVLGQQLTVERSAMESERGKMTALQEQAREREMQQTNRIGDLNSPPSSPTLSFGRASLSESVSSNWPQFSEDALETLSSSGKCSNVYEHLRMGNAASIIEGLQSQLKLREGELGQLQWELQRRDIERLALTNEISCLTTKVEELENILRETNAMDKKLNELQTSYDALLEMYGEKVEEADELRMDLADVKDMYKSQIDQLLNRDNQRQPLS